MKVRCRSCAKVVRLAMPEGQAGAVCPECGAGFEEHQQYLPNSGGFEHAPGKGTVRTQSKAGNFLGYLTVMLIIVLFGGVAAAAQAPLVGLLGIVAAIAAGAWFQNQTRKEKQ